MLKPSYSGSFSKDVKRMQKRSKDIEKLKTVINLIVSEITLPAKYKEHQLVGNWNKHKECHIEPDWLLIYFIKDDYVVFERTGTHSDLFD